MPLLKGPQCHLETMPEFVFEALSLKAFVSAATKKGHRGIRTFYVFSVASVASLHLQQHFAFHSAQLVVMGSNGQGLEMTQSRALRKTLLPVPFGLT